MKLSKKDIKRFWKKVDRSGYYGWIWLGDYNKKGQGIFKLRGKKRLASKVIHEMIEQGIGPTK